MDKDAEIKKIQGELVFLLKELQKLSGYDEDEITENTKPVGGISGFDSMRGLEATITCFGKFGISPEKVKVQNLFVLEKDTPQRALSIGEVAERIYELKNEVEKIKGKTIWKTKTN
jgi:uncharacterized small protein (DUF1192 family)